MDLTPRIGTYFAASFLLIATSFSAPPTPSPAGATTPAPQIDPKLFSGMQWRQIGPFRGGRALAISGVPGEPNTWYFGAVAGGVWKTTDGGANWKPIFDKETNLSIGALAVAPSERNTIYVGTGEAAPRGNITYGAGMYRSVDAGRSWQFIGLKDSQAIAAIAVDPRNPDVVLVASTGHFFGPNPERGIFRTADGGKTWTKVLYKDDNTGGIDVVMDPNNPNVVFASLWVARRQPWFFSSGGNTSGLFKSDDNGVTWEQLTGSGLPDGMLGRIGVTVSGADSNRVYAIIEAKEGGIYKSDDGGENWAKVNDDGRFRQRAWYFSKIYADPKSVDTVYVLNTGAFKSVDGGKSFNLLPARHGDHHGLWIDPKNSDRIGNVNDGGANLSFDGGKTWTTQNNQPTAQFYHVSTDNAFPYHIYGAQQDNSNVGIASRTDSGIIGRQDWFQAGGGECGFVLADPRDWHIIYSNSEGFINRYDKSREADEDVSVWPLDHSGHGANNVKYRFQWVSPLLISPHNPDVLYTAAQVVFKSTDQGRSWQQISQDLTRNDKSKQQPSGGPLTLDITSVEYYDTVFALAESPVKQGVLWAGTDDGVVNVSSDDGKTWSKVTPPLPEWATVSIIEPSPKDGSAAYVAVDNHRRDDFKPYIYKTKDLGKTWTQITNGIPGGAYVHSVREDPKKDGLLYAGTEQGVYVSFDDGGHWQPLQMNLPVSPVHDLVVHDDDLVVATHGRSFWVLDDLMPLRQVTPQGASADVVLYQPQTALRLHYPEEFDKRQPVGENPPSGAIIDYYFKTAPKDEVTLEVYDAQNKLVRRLSSTEKKGHEQPPEWPDQVETPKTIPAKEGMNRVAWNLRYDDPILIPGAFYYGSGPRGPLVQPGDYTVKLSANGKTQTAPLRVEIDPRTKEQAPQLQKQFDLTWKVYQRQSALHQAVNEIREVKTEIESLHQKFDGVVTAKSALAGADEFEKKISGIEGKLMQVNMKSTEGNLAFPNMLNEELYSFSNSVEGADTAPTQGHLDVFADIEGRLDDQLKSWTELKQNELPKVSDSIKALNFPALFLTPPGKSA